MAADLERVERQQPHDGSSALICDDTLAQTSPKPSTSSHVERQALPKRWTDKLKSVSLRIWIVSALALAATLFLVDLDCSQFALRRVKNGFLNLSRRFFILETELLDFLATVPD